MPKPFAALNATEAKAKANATLPSFCASLWSNINSSRVPTVTVKAVTTAPTPNTRFQRARNVLSASPKRNHGVSRCVSLSVM